jgi:serine/threonine-protein kinase
MLTCPACSADLVDSATSCRVCGAPLPADAVATIAPTSGLLDGRFEIGTTVVGRYRILGLLGRGGMGEVYRAHDNKLDQQVALKFLPEALGRDGAAVARFHNEVRTARQVTHPNVCRVHDIGEANGVPFISMEFVDGEDLASLLQRIGRLPQDKGVEVAHALCAGLAAAHARGVVHRDLKPANLMLNRAGRLVIMDFGLAGVAAQLRGPEALAGTPAYMAPEQLQAREVTARSDLYALGLVLYEIFTGARVFSGTARGPVAAPSQLVKGLSPAIDRLVLACLNDDPQRRPASAMAVARALPGGDPIAAAMRAGQTPSPEMVAASRATVRLSVRALAACFIAVLALLVTIFALMPGFTDVGMAPLEVPPDVLVARARDIATSTGYGARLRDYAFSFARDGGHLDYLRARRFDWTRLADLRPGVFVWWYRESPGWLVPRGSSPAVTREDPPLAAGDVEVVLDARSRQLLAFRAVPDEGEAGNGVRVGTPGTEPNWRPLFEAAGLDMARFAEAAPVRRSAGSFDVRRAWLGSAVAAPDLPVRVEAGALDGRAVSFVVQYPWSARAGTAMTEDRLFGMPALPGFMAIVWFSLVAGAVLVRHNYRLGRLDLRAASAVAGATFCFTLAAWLLRAHLTPTAGTMTRLSQALGASLFNAAGTFILYAGVDPYARRYWPASLVSWTRVVNGRLRDPLVGQDVLVGVFGGLVVSAGVLAYHVIAHALGGQPGPTAAGNPSVIDVTLGRLLGHYADVVVVALWGSAAALVGLLVFKAVLRRTWLVVLFMAATSGTAWSPTLGPSYPVLAAVFMSTSYIAYFWTANRFGMLAAVVTAVTFIVSMGSAGLNPSLWYGPNFLLDAALLLALAAYGFHTALAGRPLFRGNVFGEGDGELV